MRKRLWGICPDEAARTLAAQAERLETQQRSLLDLLTAERERTARLRRQLTEQEEAIARCEEAVARHKAQSGATAGGKGPAGPTPVSSADAGLAGQAERLAALRDRVAAVQAARSALIRAVRHLLDQAEEGLHDA